MRDNRAPRAVGALYLKKIEHRKPSERCLSRKERSSKSRPPVIREPRRRRSLVGPSTHESGGMNIARPVNPHANTRIDSRPVHKVELSTFWIGKHPSRPGVERPEIVAGRCHSEPPGRVPGFRGRFRPRDMLGCVKLFAQSSGPSYHPATAASRWPSSRTQSPSQLRGSVCVRGRRTLAHHRYQQA